MLYFVQHDRRISGSAISGIILVTFATKLVLLRGVLARIFI
jgi:hypothetical protein